MIANHRVLALTDAPQNLRLAACVGLVILGLALGSAARADVATIDLTIKDHRFSPTALELPAGVKVKITLKNEDATPEEFESDTLRREKIVAPGQSIEIFVGPLKPGVYEFYGDFHPETARGRVIVK